MTAASGSRTPIGALRALTVLAICVVFTAVFTRPGFAQQAGDMTFRLLTFDVGNSSSYGHCVRDAYRVHGASVVAARHS